MIPHCAARQANPQPRGGFSLMELVVAITILSAGALYTSRLFSSAGKVMEAQAVTQQLIARSESLLAGALLDTTLGSGNRREGAEGGWRWVLEAHDYLSTMPPQSTPGAQPAASNLRRSPLAEVIVTFQHVPSNRQYSLVGIKDNPPRP